MTKYTDWNMKKLFSNWFFLLEIWYKNGKRLFKSYFVLCRDTQIEKKSWGLSERSNKYEGWENWSSRQSMKVEENRTQTHIYTHIQTHMHTCMCMYTHTQCELISKENSSSNILALCNTGDFSKRNSPAFKTSSVFLPYVSRQRKEELLRADVALAIPEEAQLISFAICPFFFSSVLPTFTFSLFSFFSSFLSSH